MQYKEVNNRIELTDISDFDVVKIFECGQCFRWKADANGVYTGIVRGVPAKVWQSADVVLIQTLPATFETLWFDYFDLARDYARLRRDCIRDPYSRQAADYGQGIRILHQDRWEALCSFIISQCNNIPRIKTIIETLCRNFGEAVPFEGETLYSFPTAQTLAELNTADLAPLRCGYRAPYILEAARAVCDGRLDLDALACGSYQQALAALKQVRGIGDKVANCVILFGLQIPNAFPIDTWIRKVLDTHYEKGFDPAVFGDAAGLVQQYLFYYARSGNV